MPEQPRFPYCGRHHHEAVPGAPAIATRNLMFAYDFNPIPAIRDVSISVPAGTRIALVGPNGSGKSTLLKSLAGLIEPLRGTVSVLGRTPRECHHRVAYLPQRSELDWNFPISVQRLVLSGRYVHLGWIRWPNKRDWELAGEALARMGIHHLAQRQIGALSGGEQQRALLARALAQAADLYLLDEPLNAIDRDTRTVVGEVIEGLREHGSTVIVATHDLGRLDTDFDDSIFLMEGRVIEAPSTLEANGHGGY